MKESVQLVDIELFINDPSLDSMVIVGSWMTTFTKNNLVKVLRDCRLAWEDSLKDVLTWLFDV